MTLPFPGGPVHVFGHWPKWHANGRTPTTLSGEELLDAFPDDEDTEPTLVQPQQYEHAGRVIERLLEELKPTEGE